MELKLQLILEIKEQAQELKNKMEMLIEDCEEHYEDLDCGCLYDFSVTLMADNIRLSIRKYNSEG